MTRGRLCSLLTLGFVISSLGFGAVPASAATPPSPVHQPSKPNLGIFSERLSMMGSAQGVWKPSRSMQPLVSCSAAWRVVGGQDGTWNNELGGVAAISPTDIWAVGSSQDPITGYFRNLAEHFDGTAWSTIPVPNPGNGDNILNDVAAIATNDVWAVGVAVSNGNAGAETYHWNGTSWSTVNPAVGESLNDVVALASNDVWAVGEDLSPSNTRVVEIQHWNGSAWAITPSPSVGLGDNELFGVSALSASDVWAVGYTLATTSSTSRQTVIEHWNGSAWSVVASPNLSSDTLTSVAAASSTDAWAVGYNTGSNGLASGLTLHWNGSAWSEAGVSEPSVYGEKIADIIYSSPNYWAVGFDYGNGAGPAPPQPFALENTGSSWLTSGQNGFPAVASNNLGNNRLFAVSAPVAGGDVWAVGTFLTTAGVYKNLIENYSGLAAPTAVTVAPTDQSATVSWTLPCSDGGSSITSYVVTAYDGCAIQGSASVVGAPPATTTSFTGLTNGTAFTFKVAAVNAFGAGPQSAASSAVTPTGATKPTWVTACSTQQYGLTGNNGSTWVDMDAANLTVTFTPTVDSFAIVSGNADLWTANAGYNQDLGLALTGGAFPTTTGQPEAWKESGGFAGTFSPNAAFVQQAIPVIAATTYSARLQWKANKPDAGSIYVGAGPIGTAFSPTRLTVRLIPKSAAIVFSTSSTAQYQLTGNDGNTWVDMDPTNLKITFTWPSTGYLWGIVSANADLWTSSAGYNQDIGVAMTGGHYPSGSWLPEVWGESGGFGGTFSPNAAFVQGGVNDSTVSGTGGGTFSARLQWKANTSDPGTIYAGAGPIGGHFSPTTLTVILIPDPTFAYQAAASQYTQANSDGSTWLEMEPNHLLTQGGLGGPATWLVAANANLWTSVAGYNQDVGIMVSGGAYGSGMAVAWKESGGFAGTFSPNAAFVSAILTLQPGSSYSWWVVWKANNPAHTANLIVEGAGGAGSSSGYSQVWLTSVRLS